MSKKSQARGIRNNNAGNIRWDNQTQWRGMIGTDDKGFIIFDTPENGVRAMARILLSYNRRGVNTVQNIISTWAPQNGVDPQTGESYTNNTSSYINSVIQKTGLSQGELVTREDYDKLIPAIIHHENGYQPYGQTTINRGIAAA